MALAPPFGNTPSGWSLDGVFLSTRTPTTDQLLMPLLMPEDNRESGMLTTMLFCTPTSWPRLAEAIMAPGSQVTLDYLQLVADRLVYSHIGIDRWVMQRIWQQAVGSWMLVDGELQLRGIDVLALPLNRATNALFALLRSWQAEDAEKLNKWRRQIETPPLREIRRWKRENVPVGPATDMDDIMERARKLREQNRNAVATTPPGATITMPTSATLTDD